MPVEPTIIVCYNLYDIMAMIQFILALAYVSILCLHMIGVSNAYMNFLMRSRRPTYVREYVSVLVLFLKMWYKLKVYQLSYYNHLCYKATCIQKLIIINLKYLTLWGPPKNN